ncbi:MAG: redox-sensing transcriptional repressor Rex [Gemmatimonadota bacterium]
MNVFTRSGDGPRLAFPGGSRRGERQAVSGVRRISETTIRRLSLYLRILEEMDEGDVHTVSSGELAEGTGTTAAQVRKDLSLFGSFGKRGLGYFVHELASELKEILGLDRPWKVALVGAGRIGSALYEYAGFRERGFEIVAVLDAAPLKVGEAWGDVEVRDVSRLEEVIRDEGVEIVVLAVPACSGQDVVDRAVAAGVRGVLNFAPTPLHVPDGVALKHVNLVMELEALSFGITQAHPGRGTPAPGQPPGGVTT